ncbi:hypothetical protein TrRE_jg11130 [Triparma retinervis]|uniref:Uncharacterized protein n=1 Tax=Triparma retinervis TaxID=2557542 RepID=A0A9W7AIB2_9STRA|nr:hypothetical protein TrRE_jg11130 [Triparma retinervis]
MGKIKAKKGEERVAEETEIVGKKESITDKYASRVEDVLEKAKRNKNMREREREDEKREDQKDRRAQEDEEREEVEMMEALLKKKREREREEREVEKEGEREVQREREIAGADEKTTSGIGGSWKPTAEGGAEPEADYKPARGSWGVFERPKDISRAYGGGKRALEDVTPVCTTVTKLGVEVFLELGMAYEACSMPKEAKVCYGGVVEGGGEGRKKAETLIFRMDAKELVDGGAAKKGGRRKRVEFVDMSVLEELSGLDDKSYATTYVNLNKPATRMERLEEVSVESEEDAIDVLRNGEGGERRTRAAAYLVSAWKRVDGGKVKKERVNPVINGRVIRNVVDGGAGGFVGNYEVGGEWKLEFKVVNGVGERSKGWCVFEDKGMDGFAFKYEVGGGWGFRGGDEGVGWKVEGRVNLEENKGKKGGWEGLLKPKFPTVFDIVGTDKVVLLVREVDNGNWWGFRRVKDGEESRRIYFVLVAVAALIGTVIGGHLVATLTADDVKQVDLSSVPDAVVAAVEAAKPEGTITGAELEMEGGVEMYEITVKVGDVEWEIDVSPDGELLGDPVEDDDSGDYALLKFGYVLAIGSPLAALVFFGISLRKLKMQEEHNQRLQVGRGSNSSL